MTDTFTFTGRHIENSPLGHKPIRVSVSVGDDTARHIVILNPADLVDIADTCIGLFNAELAVRGIDTRLAIRNENA